MAFGAAIGVATTVGVSYAQGISPWTGKALRHNLPVTKEMPINNKQLGKKFGEHMDINLEGYRTINEYKNLANEIYNDPRSIIKVYPIDAHRYPGETHYYNNGNLLRMDSNGIFRSLYPF